ncbi:MAG: hypothetical protein KDC95_07855 [Planctomycetes bacterium]|nr:hypothetical protein [Planctomycetota bacterium]
MLTQFTPKRSAAAVLGAVFGALLLEPHGLAIWSRISGDLHRGGTELIAQIEAELADLRSSLPTHGSIGFVEAGATNAPAITHRLPEIADAVLPVVRGERDLPLAVDGIEPVVLVGIGSFVKTAASSHGLGEGLALETRDGLMRFFERWASTSLEAGMRNAIAYVLAPLSVHMSPFDGPTLCHCPTEDVTAFVARTLPGHRVVRTNEKGWCLAVPRHD